jgi:hypothetical protein
MILVSGYVVRTILDVFNCQHVEIQSQLLYSVPHLSALLCFVSWPLASRAVSQISNMQAVVIGLLVLLISISAFNGEVKCAHPDHLSAHRFLFFVL